MPSTSKRQQRFFQAVKHAKNNPNYGDKRLRHVANSMSSGDIDKFANHLAELKVKKAILSVLKDIADPMYLNEDEGITGDTSVDPVANTFHVQQNWAKYIKPYVGQPFSQKDIEAIHNFKEKQPTTIARTEVWYKTTDSFGSSHTTVIKKMKDSGQLSFTAFQKIEKVGDEKSQEQGQDVDSGLNAGQPTQPGVTAEPDANQQQQAKEESDKNDIIVTKSILFTDEIKGAGILIDFLKKLDL